MIQGFDNLSPDPNPIPNPKPNPKSYSNLKFGLSNPWIIEPSDYRYITPCEHSKATSSAHRVIALCTVLFLHQSQCHVR